MRILMLDNEFPPLGGGTGMVNFHLMREFADCKEVWVDLVTSSRTKNKYEVENFSKRIKIYKVPVHNRNIHHSTNAELLRYTRRGLEISFRLAKQNRYDLSFAFAGVPAGVISLLLKVTTGLPYLVSLQGPDVPGFEARYRNIYPALKPIIKLIWRNAALVTAISEDHQRLAYKTMQDIEIPIIHNGIDPETFFPAKRSTLKDKPINILCVGRLIERKGQHHLLNAIKKISQKPSIPLAKLSLVGTGDFEKDLKKMAESLGILDSVNFLGFVPQDEMPEIYRQADVFVLPSHNEGMSIALLEALASGLPVVVTDTGGTKELVEPGKNGFVVPWADVDELAESLELLLRDANLRQSMGAMSREKSRYFSWHEIARQNFDLIKLVANNGAVHKLNAETKRSLVE